MKKKDSEAKQNAYSIQVRADDLIYPYYIVEGRKKKQSIKNLQGIYRFSIDEMIKDMESLNKKGVNKTILSASHIEASLEKNILAKAIKNIRKHYPKMLVFVYAKPTGSCSPIGADDSRDWEATNTSLASSARMALAYAQAGADYVISETAEEGEIQAIRNVLYSNGCFSTKIVAVSIRYPSAFYDIAAENPSKAYPPRIEPEQIRVNDPSIIDSVSYIESDLAEGASFIMAKSSTTHLDQISRIKQKYYSTPFIACHLAGEYAMVKTAASAGALNESAAFTEVLTAIKRAGADYIVTYYIP